MTLRTYIVVSSAFCKGCSVCHCIRAAPLPTRAIVVMARIHVLYLEQADDQRGPDGRRSPGVHLNVRGLGPCLCAGCGGVADVWRGRADNMQTTLRMCCAEGSLVRPFVAQFAFASPRASLLYDVPRLGAWMHAQGTKRPTEALVVGSALRAHAGELSAEESGVACTPHAPEAEDAHMWAWVGEFVRGVRARARADGGTAVSLTLDKKAPLLCPSPMAGVLARASGAPAPRLADVIVVIGGPSGLTRGWAARLELALGEPRLPVSLRGGLQHSYAALLDVLLMQERGELLPALLDRLAVPAELLKRARAAEHELRRAWLACIGLDAQPGAGGLARALDSGHRKCMALLAGHAAANHAAGGAALPRAPHAGDAGPPPAEAAAAVPAAPRREGGAGGTQHKRRRQAATAGGGLEPAAARSVPGAGAAAAPHPATIGKGAKKRARRREAEQR